MKLFLQIRHTTSASLSFYSSSQDTPQLDLTLDKNVIVKPVDDMNTGHPPT